MAGFVVALAAHKGKPTIHDVKRIAALDCHNALHNDLPGLPQRTQPAAETGGPGTVAVQ